MSKVFNIIVLGILLNSCASLTQKFDADRAKNVQKVAIVAIEIQQEKPTDNLGLSGFNEIKNGTNANSSNMQTMVKNVVQQFSVQLQKKTKWQVIPLEQMMKNSEYANRFQQDMTGARAVSIADNRVESIYLNGTLDTVAFRKMSLADRAKLARALNVDALLELVIINSIEQSRFSLGHLTGDADFKYSGRANVQLYSADSEEPIMRSQNVTGQTTKSSSDLPEKMSKLEKLSTLGEEASVSATTELISKIPL